jgi:transcriptional regulator with XRE-family HTH domain
MLTHKELKARALARADVKAEYDRLDEEFNFLDQFLEARAAASMTQTQIAERIGTTQSAIARLESGKGKHLPSLATLQKYAQVLGCRLELRLVKKTKIHKVQNLTNRSTSPARKQSAG